MVVPAPPRAQFVVVEPDLPFAFLKTRLDGPAHTTDADQRGQRGERRRAAQGIRHLDGLLVVPAGGNRTADDDPDLGTGQAVAHRHGPDRSKVCDQGAVAAFQDAVAVPLVRTEVGGEFVDAQRWRAVRVEALFGRWASFARGSSGRHCRGGPPPWGRAVRRLHQRPDRRVLWHIREVVQARRRDPVEEARVPPKPLITDDPACADPPCCDDCLDQFGGELRLGAERRPLRNAAGIPPLPVVHPEPLHREVQTTIQQGVAVAAGIPQVDPSLTVVGLPPPRCARYPPHHWRATPTEWLPVWPHHCRPRSAPHRPRRASGPPSAGARPRWQHPPTSPPRRTAAVLAPAPRRLPPPPAAAAPWLRCSYGAHRPAAALAGTPWPNSGAPIARTTAQSGHGRRPTLPPAPPNPSPSAAAALVPPPSDRP